ncbi:MAG: hypothetical protein EZS28_032218 [Streblomastix strix]|uniref:Uncharacterized protein n=1 Tax=Streblomastix strix TaxID=222440 RepID=A0A5J4UR41_9EUKA|nr:MAG: hypothetical protein EZS28_032218 [Streblomastix strix]
MMITTTIIIITKHMRTAKDMEQNSSLMLSLEEALYDIMTQLRYNILCPCAIIQMDSGAHNLCLIDFNCIADSSIPDVKDSHIIQAVSGILNFFDIRYAIFVTNQSYNLYYTTESDVVKADINHLRFQGVRIAWMDNLIISDKEASTFTSKYKWKQKQIIGEQ